MSLDFKKLLLLLFICFSFAREYTPEEKLSQMFMLGFKGTEYQEFSKFTGNDRWGGYIFYSKDAAGKNTNIVDSIQAKKLLKSIQGSFNDTRIKPFLAIDMEGGKLQIAKNEQGDTFTFFNEPKKIALAKREKKEIWASNMAALLNELGFNVNLAPVVDVDKKPFRNSRCFSGNADNVIWNSLIFLDKHKAKGVICTLKHFPGRGSGRQKDIDEQYSMENDLRPFKELSSQNAVGLIMISTRTFPLIDPNNPAHKSSKILNLLRSFGYQKIAITDDLSDLNSKDISDEQLTNEIIEIISAGNDMLLFANSAKNYDPDFSKRLTKLVKNIIEQELIPEERIEQSFTRILKVKQDNNIEPTEIYLNYTL